VKIFENVDPGILEYIKEEPVPLNRLEVVQVIMTLLLSGIMLFD